MTEAPRKMKSTANCPIFSTSDDTTMIEKIRVTHAPIDEHIDVRRLLNAVQDIFNHIRITVQGKQVQLGGMKDDGHQSDLTDMLDISYHTINKISCEISSKCMGGVDPHATTIGILEMLSGYSWDAKVVIALAAFAANFGEFWLVVQLGATNHLAKSVAVLKHIHETVKQVDDLGPKFETVTKLLTAMLDVTKCIVKFHELRSQYIDLQAPEILAAAPEILAASTLILDAVYWTIQSIVACASHIFCIIDLGKGYMTSTKETRKLSRLADKLNNKNDHLERQLTLCHQHLGYAADDNKQREAVQKLRHLFETSDEDNSKVLSALICSKDDKLFDGSTEVGIDVLTGKIVLLYITDLQHISDHELTILKHMYQKSRQDPTRSESRYELVWLPVVDKGTPCTEIQEEFKRLRSKMPWYSLNDPLEPATTRYIKEEWRFNTEPILVALDKQGKVVNLNALHMMWIWGTGAFPFSSSSEEALWERELWGLSLLADTIHPSLFDWVSEGRYICLYGGDDMEWIRKFIKEAHSVARARKIPLEMIYVGKSNPGTKVLEINKAIKDENLSNVLADPSIIWYFWVRLESIRQCSKTVENAHIMAEIILKFDISDKGWAVLSEGTTKMIQAKGDTFLKCLNDYDLWKDDAELGGLFPTMDGYIQELQTRHTNASA